MTSKTPKDPYGSFPDNSSIVLVLIDVITDLNFHDGEKFKKSFATMSKHLKKLVDRARSAGIPVIYVNDNFGKWRSDFKSQVAHCIKPESINRDSVLRLVPGEGDYYILKPRHSAFYASPFDLMLRGLKAETLILSGMSAESCVLFTAINAHLREYKLILPKDCLASATPSKCQKALAIAKESLHAEIKLSSEIQFGANKKKTRAKAKTRRGP